MGCKTKRKKKTQNKPKIHLPGIHYVGQMQEGSIIRFMVDQLTEGQLEWAQLPAVYDTVVLGEPGSGRTYRIYSGKEEYFQRLKEQFPGEGAAIDEFERLVKVKGALASPQGGDGGIFLALVPLCRGQVRRGKSHPPQHPDIGQLQRIAAFKIRPHPAPKALGNIRNLPFLPQKPGVAPRVVTPLPVDACGPTGCAGTPMRPDTHPLPEHRGMMLWVLPASGVIAIVIKTVLN